MAKEGFSIPAKIKSSAISHSTKILDEVIDHYVQNKEANYLLKTVTKAVRDIGEQKHLYVGETLVATKIESGPTELVASQSISGKQETAHEQ